MLKSRWFARRWLWFWLYVGLVFLMVPFARDAMLTLRNSNLLGAAVTALYGGAVALVVYHVFFDLRYADWIALLVVAALIAGIAALLLGLSIPEERVHFLQYGAMSLLARGALDRGPPRADTAMLTIAGAAGLASLIGLLEECAQGLLPDRRFDWRDVAMNTAGAVIALFLDELLHDRSRLRARYADRERSS
jgi:hypothetical protein